MSFHNSNFEGNFITMCLQVILTLSRLENRMLGFATYIMMIILNFSYVSSLEFFVKK